MHSNFLPALRFTLGHEGIYSNRADDPGGETYSGISRVYYPDWIGWEVVDMLKSQDANLHMAYLNDVELKEYVALFYRENKWDKISGDDFAWSLALTLFDASVNLGSKRAVKWLQETCIEFSGTLEPDGVLGPYTRAEALRHNPIRLANKVNAKRMDFYFSKRKSKRQFFDGWMARMIQVIDESVRV